MKLSIIIPARNEEFLGLTIKNLLENIEGETEIIAVLDGYDKPIPELPQDSRVKYIKNDVSIGQRAATNQAVRLSEAKYICKVDAHCAFDKGFDVKMMADMQDNWTMIPTMYNLHAFNWVCSKCNVKEYQGTSHPCPKCGGIMIKDIIWKEKRNPCSQFYRFDNTLHFQYWNEYKKRPEAQGDLAETMSIQGSCFMLTRDKYWELNICDEKFGSWGQQGVEVACKTWLSGGRVIVNKKTWYAHMFRTQGGDFGFPYPNPGIQKARDYSKELFLNNKFDKAIYPFHWIIDKFSPVPDWDKFWGVVYYTNNDLDEKIMKQCQEQIKLGIGQHKLISVSDKKIDFGDNLQVDYGTGAIAMFKKILAGLELVGTDYVFLCEHDVLYHPSHFKFIPPTNDKYYYNQNCWQLRASDGLAVYYDCKRLSQLCANRELLIKHYKERIRRCEAEGFSRRMGFEPGSHGRPERVDDIGSEVWRSEYPNIDIKHDRNFTEARWKPEQFRSQRSCRNWQESNNINGWGQTNKILI